MRHSYLYFIVTLQILMLAGCNDAGRTTEVLTDTPVAGMHIITKKHQGRGVLEANTTDVYITLEKNGESAKELVLHGTYLTIEQIEWTDPNTATICLRSGYTSKFYNYVALNLNSQRLNHPVHFFLREDCKP